MNKTSTGWHLSDEEVTEIYKALLSIAPHNPLVAKLKDSGAKPWYNVDDDGARGLTTLTVNGVIFDMRENGRKA